MSLITDSISGFIIYLDSEVGLIIYSFIYILAVIFILPASWLSLLAGFLYGQYIGTLIVFIDAFIGASIAFFVSKNFLLEKIYKIVSGYPKLLLLEKVIKKGGLKFIILTRLSPVFPFSILNYFYGLNKISFKDFSLSLIFILPGTFLYCSLGSLANNLDDIKNLKMSNNLLTTLVSILSTSLVVYLFSKYSKEILQDKENI